MEKMVVIVFDSEPMAWKGDDVLKQLDIEGNISVHARAVIKKNLDGSITQLKTKEEFPIRTGAGTAIGSLIGLLGGPVGVFVGAVSGAALGAIDDIYRSEVNVEFLDDVSTVLLPGKYALVADISEEWVTPLDVGMAGLGGTVLRARRRYVEIDQTNSDIDAVNEELDQLEKEMKTARAEHKANLQAKIAKLKAKREARIEHAQKRLEQMEREYSSKIEALKEKGRCGPGDRRPRRRSSRRRTSAR